jgi:hypothetical protein
MSFLDNLENNLKNAESAAERDPAEAARKHAAREAERAAAQASLPYAQQLRHSRFTADLLNHASLLGRSRRLLVRVLWLQSNLRLQVREHSLELRPTANGVVAHFFKGSFEYDSFPVDFSANAEDLARRWLDSITA